VLAVDEERVRVRIPVDCFLVALQQVSLGALTRVPTDLGLVGFQCAGEVEAGQHIGALIRVGAQQGCGVQEQSRVQCLHLQCE
ncbi:hypothetical protein, partial [Pseudomonas syringae group genomosp. 7]|uniref:hypothetical protein n=1 Tax=Pseudomonas syringae group genomosp. 7 TaxID=251699 RepID=UPI00376FB753